MTDKKRKKYSREFKEEAIKLVTEQGYKVSEAATNMGIHADTLGRWKRELERGEAGHNSLGVLMSKNNNREWSNSAHALASLGEETTNVIKNLYEANDELNLFVKAAEDDELKILAQYLNDWDDQEAAKLVRAYASELENNREVKVSELCRWVGSHKNQADSVLECMRVKTPRDIQIIKILSKVGSQKSVYLSYWQAEQDQYVAKVINGPEEVKNTILARELINHPLSHVHSHPCIIKTYPMQNDEGEIFLIEEYIPEILSDTWKHRGDSEIANLLRDIAAALAFLHDTHHLVHGDVKPDNIGKGERFILLDFGICRAVKDFNAEVTGTGSLRTRAPEVILDNSYEDPRKVDVWALGATVFQVCTGRFPLFEKGEEVARVSNPEEREVLEKELKRRIDKEWDSYVKYDEIDNSNLRHLLEKALLKDPQKRVTSSQLLEEVKTVFPAFLIPEKERGSSCSPVEELAQMEKFLTKEKIQLMPIEARRKLDDKLNHIKWCIEQTENGERREYSNMFDRVNSLCPVEK